MTKSEKFEVFTDLDEAQAVAHEAWATDREMFHDWLIEQFPVTMSQTKQGGGGKEMTLAQITAEFQEGHCASTWNRESILRSLAGISCDEVAPKLYELRKEAAIDWAAQKPTHAYTGKIKRLPDQINTEDVHEAIAVNGRKIEKAKRSIVMPQSFGGVVVRGSGVAAQFTSVESTQGFAMFGRKGFENGYYVRAWRLDT